MADGPSRDPVTSFNGRYTAFTSSATNLVPLDGNASNDVFRYDSATQTTVAVSATPSGSTSNGSSGKATMSLDGRYIAYESTASDIAPADDTKKTFDVFRYDAITGDTTLVSRPSSRGAYPGSFAPSLSGDGRWVAFVSRSGTFVQHDTNHNDDVFLYDTKTGHTTKVSRGAHRGQLPGRSYDPDVSTRGRFITYSYGFRQQPTQVYRFNRATGRSILVSTGTDGRPAQGDSQGAAINGDGRYIAFESTAADLVRKDSNHAPDVFLYDAKTERTSLVSVDVGGGPSDGASRGAGISTDGKDVIFQSSARDLAGTPVGVHVNVYERYLGRGGQTVLVSESSGRRPANGPSSTPSISGNGLVKVFSSSATNVLRPDTREVDIFVYAYI